VDTSRYPLEVFWSEEDEGFIAVALDLPGCSAFGETQEEAIREVQDAITAWLSAAEAAGNPVPSPSPRQEFSGKFIVRLPKTLHASLALQAKREESSLNQYVLYLLAKSHEGSLQASAARSASPNPPAPEPPRPKQGTAGARSGTEPPKRRMTPAA